MVPFCSAIDTGRIRSFATLFGGVAFVKDILMRRIIARTVETGWQIPCLAGRISLVIDERTNVYPCEMLPAVGNLRDHDHDMGRVLAGSTMATALARITDEHCFCTHECAYSTNVLFAFRLWPAMAWNLLKLHAKKLAGRRRFTAFDAVAIPKPRVARQYDGQGGALYAGGRTFGEVDAEERRHQPARPF